MLGAPGAFFGRPRRAGFVVDGSPDERSEDVVIPGAFLRARMLLEAFRVGAAAGATTAGFAEGGGTLFKTGVEGVESMMCREDGQWFRASPSVALPRCLRSR